MKSLLTALFWAPFLACIAEAKDRTYYVQAEDVTWDYAPTDWNLVGCKPLEYDAAATPFISGGGGYIGRIYKKALYYQYTDDTFTTRVPRDDSLGFLGPVLRAEVGDTMRVIFKNAASMPFTMHPHGVFYDKDQEGAAYGGIPINGSGAGVEPGNTHEYVWLAVERSGPTATDGNCVLWAYHSHVMVEQDIYSGLVGPLVVCRAGILDDNNMPTDVTREIFSHFNVDDEYLSNYINDNVATYAKLTLPLWDGDMIESNLMHNINGLMFGNNVNFMCRGDKVRWYVFAFGTEVDMHTAHWHGQTVTHDGHRVDTMELLPATFRVVEMQPDEVGEWLFHCHVNDHNMAGMTEFYTVLDTADPSCAVNTLKQPDGLNKARTEFINQAVQRCSEAENAYAVDLPLVEPLGQDNAMYEGSEYLDWAQRHETLLQDPTYMRLRYLRCPAPEVCVAGYFGNNVVDENVALAWALSFGGALTLLLAPLLALVRPFKNGQHVVIGAVVSLAAGCVLWMAIAVYTAESFAYMCCEVQQYKLAGLAVFFVGVIAAAGCDAMFGSINRSIEKRRRAKASAVEDGQSDTLVVRSQAIEVVAAAPVQCDEEAKKKGSKGKGSADNASEDSHGSVSAPPMCVSTFLCHIAMGMGVYFAAKLSTGAGVAAVITMVAFNMSKGIRLALGAQAPTSRLGARLPRGMDKCIILFLTQVVGAVLGFAFLEADSPVLFGSIMGVLAGVLVQQVLVHTLPAAYQLDPYHGKWVGLWALIGVLLVVVATSQ